MVASSGEVLDILVVTATARLVVAASEDVLVLEGLEATALGGTENVIVTAVVEETAEGTLVNAGSCELLVSATDDVVIGFDDGVILDSDGVGPTPSVSPEGVLIVTVGLVRSMGAEREGEVFETDEVGMEPNDDCVLDSTVWNVCTVLGEELGEVAVETGQEPAGPDTVNVIG